MQLQGGLGNVGTDWAAMCLHCEWVVSQLLLLQELSLFTAGKSEA